MIFDFLRALLVLTGTIFGVALGYASIEEYPEMIKLENPQMVAGALLGFIGYLFCSIAGRELQAWLEKQLDQSNTYDLTWGAVGMLGGLVSANLLFVPIYFLMFKGHGEIKFNNAYLDPLVPFAELVVPLTFSLLFGYLGIKIILRYRKYQAKLTSTGIIAKPKVVDSSALIDGRFADLYSLGFLEGNIIVPQFVVNELHLFANAEEELKKSRGQKGLDTLKKLKHTFPDIVVTVGNDFPEISEISAKLIKLALEIKAVIVTHDYSIKKLAELDNVSALNVNDLANALKPIFVCGESIEVKIVKKGKESRQGVGFLSDGTMVVVEDGGDMVGETVFTSVSNVLQTGAGRMIFTKIGDKKL